MEITPFQHAEAETRLREIRAHIRRDRWFWALAVPMAWAVNYTVMGGGPWWVGGSALISLGFVVVWRSKLRKLRRAEEAAAALLRPGGDAQ